MNQRRAKPIVFITAPPCTGLSGWRTVNSSIGSLKHAESARNSTAMGTLAGEVCEWQLKCGRHFLSENPKGSTIYKLRPWQRIATDPRVRWTYVDQCAAGLRDFGTKKFIRKGTEFWASCEELIEPPQAPSMQRSTRASDH